MTREITDLGLIESEDRFAKITDDAIASLLRLRGVPITNMVEPWCYDASRDNIRHFAYGIGDDNPLWSDPAYAEGTKYGTIVAPPSFVLALNRILSGYVGGLPGVHAMWAGADLVWHRPILQDTKVVASAHLKDLVEHKTRFADRAFQQIYHVELSTIAGELLCSGESWCFRTERDTARELGTKYKDEGTSEETSYSDADLRQIYDLYDSEIIRGAEARYFEDVEVGDELPTMAKGPMTVTGFIAFAQGWGGLYIRANKLAYEQLKRHPDLGIRNSQGIPDVPERVHWEHDLAVAVGPLGAYDYGPERCSWLIHHLTNWFGDDGFLSRHTSQIRHHNIVGDWIRINGIVSEKGIDSDGRNYIIVEQTAHNQHGDLSAFGTGIVRLPTRS